ncbi:MAG: tetratricopeptide repeat protein [Vicinamibacteraceae bacterium]
MLCVSASAGVGQPADPGLLQRYAAEGEKALAEQRYDQAVRAFEKLRELAPESAEVHAKLGLVYYQTRDFARAVQALQRAVTLKPTLPKIDVLLAMSRSELGRYAEALPGLRNGFQQASDPPLRRSAGLHLMRAYAGLEKDDAAVEIALALSRLHPDDPEVLYHAGRLFANFAYLQTVRLSQVAPESVWRHQAAGEAHESLGQLDAALRSYRRVLALDPDRPGVHYRLGRVLLSRSAQLGANEASLTARSEAAKAFEQELVLDPTNADAAYELGEIHRRSGDLGRARELFEEAVRHYPDLEQARVGLGRVLIATDKPQQAVPHLETAVSLDPELDVAFFHLAQAHRALGHVEESRRALAEFKRLRARTHERERLVFLRQHEVTPQEVDARDVPR